MFRLHLVLLCAIILSPFDAWAEFDPERLSRSTVRIMIKHQGQVISVATGFVWQQPSWIVTSLHILHPDPNSKIIIEFGKKRRKATIKAVLPEADLVLLEVKRPLTDWTALTSYDEKKPQYRSTVTALGFHRGALGMSTRELVKGYVKPEELQQLLPSQALALLAKSNMPSLTLPIYYLDGSLLPGYSGSPVVNAHGQLIGIGDGGLENGAANVSWIIPARFLTDLVQSTESKLPAQMHKTNALFSLDRSEAQYKTSWIFEDIGTYFQQNPFRFMISSANAAEEQNDLPFSFIEVNYQHFKFVKIKTRSFEQMLDSSGKPSQVEYVLTIFKQFFPDHKIPYQSQLFDIYSDAHYGLNIILPAGTELVTDSNGYLLAQGEVFCRTCPYEIQYHARVLSEQTQQKIQVSADGFLNHVADQHWNELNQEGDYEEYLRLRQIEKYGSHRYVLRALFSNFEEPFIDSFELNYFSAATSRDAWFQVQGIINVFDDKFMERIDKYKGIDCTVIALSTAESLFCREVLTTFNVIASTHLTSFSNRIFSH